MTEQTFLHQPVLLAEALDYLNLQENGIYVDATFGRGGHTRAILNKLGPHGRVIAIDQDPDAIEYAHAQFAHEPRLTVIHGSFATLGQHIHALDLNGKINGILMDIGVSSVQLDNPERGFSFMHDGPLDMRMNHSSGEDAATWLAHVSEAELTRVLFTYGEEPLARRIARRIIETRETSPILTTRALADLIKATVGTKPRRKGGKIVNIHPATKTFQAIRIAINGELDALSNALEDGLNVLAPGGRLVVICFHSLEDRIVKRFFRDETRGKIPIGAIIKEADIVTRMCNRVGPIRPSASEIRDNPRARSALLRAGEKC